MASIDFRPVCSNCNRIITEEVGVEYLDELLPNHYLEHRQEHVYPHRCPYCLEWFDTLTIPKPNKIPYRNASLLDRETTELMRDAVFRDKRVENACEKQQKNLKNNTINKE